MINRKAGVHVKISDVFRKRALFGVAIFCITAIATVGALSTGENKEDKPPESLVDLNATDHPEQNQTADNQDKQPEVKNPDGQTADNTEDLEPSNADEPGGTEVAEQPEDTDKPEEKNPSEVAKLPEEEPEQSSQTALNPEPEEPTQTEVLSPQLIAEQLNFDRSAGLLWPVSGQVVIPYSPDHGVYYYTLDQFGTSDAMVLSAAAGTEVKAAAKGVVTSIDENYRTGTTVTLALGNNTSLVYGQLTLDDLKEGDVVEAGECIGTVAEPTRYFVVEGPNLYFQVMEGETSINPAELLREE